jgi:hypothetical protein
LAKPSFYRCGDILFSTNNKREHSNSNAFFALVTSLGRLDIAAILSSLYPVMTILLTRLILDEHITKRQ